MRKEASYEEVKDENKTKQAIGESVVGNPYESDYEKDAGKGNKESKDRYDGEEGKVLKRRGRKPSK